MHRPCAITSSWQRAMLQPSLPKMLRGIARGCLNIRRFAEVAKTDPRAAVVKIFNTRQRPGWTVPWQDQPVESTSGSGAVIRASINGGIPRHAVLTAAHVIADSRYLQVQRTNDRYSGEKFRAHVAAVCHEIDLALLTLEEDVVLEAVKEIAQQVPEGQGWLMDPAFFLQIEDAVSEMEELNSITFAADSGDLEGEWKVLFSSSNSLNAGTFGLLNGEARQVIRTRERKLVNTSSFWLGLFRMEWTTSWKSRGPLGMVVGREDWYPILLGFRIGLISASTEGIVEWKCTYTDENFRIFRASKEMEPLMVGSATELPRVFDKVRVVGYPVGGDACSVTEGVVSRVEVQEYSHSLRFGLALTVDAAINSGNSGGPLVDASTAHVVGVAFQKMVARGVELQGHAVPSPVIQRFLEDVASDSSESSDSTQTIRLRMPSLGCDYQSLEPVALREHLRLDGRRGILVSRLHNAGDAPAALQGGDVLMSFNGFDLDELGFCSLLGRRLHFGAARDLCRVGTTVTMKVWRSQVEQTVQQVLQPARHLVPRGQFDVRPRFFMVGGLVFQPLNVGRGDPQHFGFGHGPPLTPQ
ncbi:Protease Do-like 2, chloroplastic [Symbiodinium microadriaticum]|uniref:Protease Do-like 2, chloroplastic n=1 Tax=Symbiodinium microadriaticum TaxID=2951 RepID=A0A1Q9CXY4_SYMMI|nr:Protease Do-like 2, chloroplastic [Symbiodinium microadriaticum]